MIDDNDNFKVINAAYPGVGKRLQFLWGYPEFHALMDELQQDTKGVLRQGFPEHILIALLDLESDHDREFPQLIAKKSDIWKL
ncbi:MAG: hypothetical protein RL710_115 [Pseudomonadota bacterium]|jgi:hypothetical protein